MSEPTEMIPHTDDHDPYTEFWHCVECAQMRRGGYTPLLENEDAWLHNARPPQPRRPAPPTPARAMEAAGVPDLFAGLEDEE